MVYFFAFSVALTVALVIFLIAQSAPSGQSHAVRDRLHELGLDHSRSAARMREARRERINALLQTVGDQVQERYGDPRKQRQYLIQAGYRNPGAVGVFWGIRLFLTAGLGLAGLFLGSLVALDVDVPGLAMVSPGALLGAFYGAAMGWVLPALRVRQRRAARQKELQLALPDALDLMVICVEAGLGLNQAMVRVAEEIGNVSLVMTEELALTNFEIRAGTPRHEALHHLGERTGVEDLRALATMLIQADRFGTSIAQSLRVHADTLRMKRRQRAEEAAAKTAIKMLFPLVFCIFPALFVVILGPAFIDIFTTLGGLF